MITAEKEKADSAYYHEVCLLRLLGQMGYLDQKALNGIAQIAAEDYGATLVLDKTFLCLN
ncbi:MAG: hypothetical protein ACI4F6_04955 [Acutalibacteraceae bacterium]